VAITMYCHLKPPDAMPLQTENFCGLGTPAT